MGDDSFRERLLAAKHQGEQTRQQQQEEEAAELRKWEAERIANIQKRIVDAVLEAATRGTEPSLSFANFPDECFTGDRVSQDATARLRGDALLAFQLLTFENLNPRATIETFQTPGGPYLHAVLRFDQPSK